MRFSLVTENFLGTDGQPYQGGAELHLAELARLLRDDGHDVSIVQAAETRDTFQWQGIAVRTLPVSGQGIVRRGRFIANWPAAVDDNTEWVHLNQYYLSRPVRRHWRLTATCHGVDFDIPSDLLRIYGETPPLHLPVSVTRRALRVQARHAIRSLDAIGSVDTAFLHFAQATLPDQARKVMFLPNFVEDSFFEKADSFHSEHSGPVVLFPRNPSPSRGTHLVLGAVAELRRHAFCDIELWIAGGGPKTSPLSRMIDDLQLTSTVKRLGQLPHSEMAAVMRRASVVVIPSVCAEGTSLACLEAMAAQRPIVVTPTGGLTDLVVDGYNGLVAEPSILPFADAIERVLTDRPFGDSLAAKARDLAESYRLNHWRDRWRGFFHSL